MCVLLLYGSENGDPDEECGVHAPVPVPCFSGERHLLDCLRPHQIRPLHHRKEPTTPVPQVFLPVRFTLSAVGRAAAQTLALALALALP